MLSEPGRPEPAGVHLDHRDNGSALRQPTGSESTEEVRAHVVEYLDETDGVDELVKVYAWDDQGELTTDNGDVWMWEWTRRRGFRMLGSVAELIR